MTFLHELLFKLIRFLWYPRNSKYSFQEHFHCFKFLRLLLSYLMSLEYVKLCMFSYFGHMFVHIWYFLWNSMILPSSLMIKVLLCSKCALSGWVLTMVWRSKIHKSQKIRHLHIHQITANSKHSIYFWFYQITYIMLNYWKKKNLNKTLPKEHINKKKMQRWLK